MKRHYYICECGKRVYFNPVDAQRTMTATFAFDPKSKERSPNVYFCPVSRTYHWGHSEKRREA